MRASRTTCVRLAAADDAVEAVRLLEAPSEHALRAFRSTRMVLGRWPVITRSVLNRLLFMNSHSNSEVGKLFMNRIGCDTTYSIHE